MTVPYSSPQAPAIGGLKNVSIDISTLANEDVIKFNEATNLWENGPDNASGGVATKIVITDTNTDATFYPTFCDGAGVNQTIRCDQNPDEWSINPLTGAFNFVNTLKLGEATSDGRVAVGANAGLTLQDVETVAIGLNAGNSKQQKWAVAVGSGAGETEQQTTAVAIGRNAGNEQQSSNAVAVGNVSGFSKQSKGAVAVGNQSGNDRQGSSAVAIGNNAGLSKQGENSIAIGNNAATSIQPTNQICLNASGLAFTGVQPSGFYVNPIRRSDNGSGVGNLTYEPLTFEITYSGT